MKLRSQRPEAKRAAPEKARVMPSTANLACGGKAATSEKTEGMAIMALGVAAASSMIARISLCRCTNPLSNSISGPPGVGGESLESGPGDRLS